MTHSCIPSRYKLLKVPATALFRPENIMKLVSHLSVNWMCIDDVVDLLQSYCNSFHSGTINLNINNIFTCNVTTLLVLFPDHNASLLSENHS